jgi:hypothetical protein
MLEVAAARMLLSGQDWLGVDDAPRDVRTRSQEEAAEALTVETPGGQVMRTPHTLTSQNHLALHPLTSHTLHLT